MTGKISIFGEIGKDVTVQDIQNQIQANALATELEVQMSSPGGDVFDGYAIYNLLKNTNKPVTTVVVGLCASIATLIAAAGKIVMNKTAQFMIHNPSIAGLQGDARDLRSTADQLDKIKSLLIDVYQQKTGLPKEKLWEMYDNETWLTAAEAGPNGYNFVDDVHETIKAVAFIDDKKFKSMDNSFLQRIENGIKRLTNLFKYKNMITDTTSEGKVVTIMAEDGEDWTGKPVTYEDGSPLPAGDITLMSGNTITVDESSTIVQVTPAAPASPEPPVDNTMEDKIKELEAKLKESNDALAAANAAKQTAEAKAKTFENSLKTIQKDVDEMKKTFGDTKPPKDGFKQFMNVDDQDVYDPMGEDFKKALKAREII